MGASVFAAMAEPVCRAASSDPKRVAVLRLAPDEDMDPRWRERDREWQVAFSRELGRQGFREGDNVHIRWYDVPVRSHWDVTLPKVVAQMLEQKPDCIVTPGGSETETRYVQRATREIPIVADVGDPVTLGFAASLAHPGGNITGLHQGYEEVALKELELFRALMPGLRCVGWIAFEPQKIWLPTFERAARMLNLRVRTVVPRSPGDAAFPAYISREMAALAREGCAAAHFHTGVPQFRDLVLPLALKHRIALSYGNPERTGVMLSYGMDRSEQFRSAQRLPAVVARILRGERPQDIAFEGPTRYRLALNLKTAELIGLRIPPEVLVLADDVVR